MSSPDRLAMIVTACIKLRKRPHVNRVDAYIPPLREDEREEVALTIVHNDDESIIDEEQIDACVSPELARTFKAERLSHDRADDLLFTPSERKQIEEDKWANRRRFAPMVVPPTIASMIRA